MARTCWRGSGRQVSSEASSWKVKVCRLDLTEEEVSDLLVPGAGRCFFDGNEKSLMNHLRLSFTGCTHPEVWASKSILQRCDATRDLLGRRYPGRVSVVNRVNEGKMAGTVR